MKATRLVIISALAALLAGCAAEGTRGSKVYQGTCLGLEDGGKLVKLANDNPELNPVEGESATFDISSAKVGLAPEPGNVIRLSFFKQGEKLVALKVMNVTKQDLRKE